MAQFPLMFWYKRSPHIKEVPIFVAGGIGRGEIILKFLDFGKEMSIGTRFVCANESIILNLNIFIKSEARIRKFQLKLMIDYLLFL